MITATRDGAVVSAPEINHEQRDALWVAVFRAYLQTHPEEASMSGQDAVSFGTGDT